MSILEAPVENCDKCKPSYISYSLSSGEQCFDHTDRWTRQIFAVKKICHRNGDKLPLPKSKLENDLFMKLVEKKNGKSNNYYYPLDLEYIEGKGYVMENDKKPVWTNWKTQPINQTFHYALMSAKDGFWVTKPSSQTGPWEANVVCQQICSPPTPEPTTTDSPTTKQATTTTLLVTTAQSKISLETTTKLNQTQLLALNEQLYVNRLMARLENFNKILETKITTFELTLFLTEVDFEPRLVFLMVTEDLVKKYEARYEKRQKRKHIVSIFKLTATVTLLALGVFLVYTLVRMGKSMVLNYSKLKIVKEKRKQLLKINRKRVLSCS